MSVGFEVTLEQYHGPLDLMLHLIKENKLNLFDLDVLALANQYITYLQQMETLNLEISSEYLVELASLLEYKSKKLLPKETSVLDSEYQAPTEEQLIARLIEYQRFKQVAQALNLQEAARNKLLGKPASSLLDQWIGESSVQIENMELYQLVSAFEKCKKRMAVLEPLKLRVAEKELSVEERVEQVMGRIEQLPKVFTFEDLCSDCEDLPLLVLTFMAILEMIKNQVLVFRLMQDTIYLQKGVMHG
jgi:segregation and condensation protein A